MAVRGSPHANDPPGRHRGHPRGLAPQPARADDPSYGEQIVLADGASVGVFYAAVRLANRRDDERWLKVATGVGVGSYILFAPAVHLIGHGREDRAAISLGMRLVPTFFLVSATRCGGGEEGGVCLVGRVLLAAVGALAATGIDTFVVSDGGSPEPMPVMFDALSGRF